MTETRKRISAMLILAVAIVLVGALMLSFPTANNTNQKPLKEVFENGIVEIEIGEDISEFSLERVGDGILIGGNQVQVYYEPEKGKCTKCTISGDFFTEKSFPCDRKIQKIIVM